MRGPVSMLLSPVFWVFLILLTTRASTADEPVGQRPYEMVWANRIKDVHPPLVDFEDLAGWTVECHDAAASFGPSREEQIWGRYVGKLAYHGTGGKPTILVKPPRPIRVSGPFWCVNLWVYGNNWSYSADSSTPQVQIAVLLKGRSGKPVRIAMGSVHWKEWWVMHRCLAREIVESLGSRAQVEALEITGGRNTQDRVLYFDNLALYQQSSPPLIYEPRPLRGINLSPGQTTGANTGPGRLPFPNREETILPDNLTADFKTSLEESNGAYVFRYRGTDGELTYRYAPSSGTLGDISAQWTGRGGVFHPMADGGVYFSSPEDRTALPPKGIERLACRRRDDTVESIWRYARSDGAMHVTYTLRLWQKSLVIDVKCLGGKAGEVRFGRAIGLDEPRLVTLPYLTCGSERPAVLVSGPAQKPLFLMGLVDYYRSNASMLWASNQVAEDGATYNGGSRYLPKTNGRRNDCFERLFLTVSPRFEEVLPNIANPQSPWMQVAGERVWRAHGASNREQDYARWKEVARYGMSKVLITDHETGWRDGGESFTLRTRAAPGKGGDEGQADYARKIHALGFRYGIYNNYTDFAPVNEHWNEDYVTRQSDGEWLPAWARCYNLKPSRAVELEARLTPIIQEKFHLDTAYCDVHTAVTPWRNCDFDARVPGAGTFAATLYAYGEIMLHQKKTWNGPVYSEGNNHWYYCGLTDGNYGQDQIARLDVNPWLVDFDLRKLHPLCCNFGMGNPGMFYGKAEGLGRSAEEQDSRLDRFLAATLAFGHTGFLVLEGGMANAVRSYFGVQQVHAAYAQEKAVDIRYADGRGHLLDTSAAVAGGAFRRSQVEVRYSNGLVVSVNGNPSETWKTADAVIPPNGWYVRDASAGKLRAFSALVDGHRADYVDSPAYLYADGRGHFTRFDKAACDGQLIAHKRPGGSFEVIPVGRTGDFGIALDGSTGGAVALDKQGKQIGPALTRFSRGLVYVRPVAGAFSYLVSPGAPPEVSLKCDREKVVPGEEVRVVGDGEHVFRVPADARPGQRLWQRFGNAWIDFTVVPLVGASLRVQDGLTLELCSNLAGPTEASGALADERLAVRLSPRVPVTLRFGQQRFDQEGVREVPLEVAANGLTYRRSWTVKTAASIAPIAAFPAQIRAGQCLRKGSEQPLEADSGASVSWLQKSCGGAAKKCLFMHPPYKTGVGYAFAVSEPIELPVGRPAAFRCIVGKADGSDPGDGILFRAAVVDGQGRQTIVAEKQWIEHAWTPLEADLSPWAGQRVELKLISDVGPKNNSSGDWACWADLRVETLQPVLASTVQETP